MTHISKSSQITVVLSSLYFATKWNGSQFVGYNVWGSNGPEYLGKSLSKSFHNNQKRKIGVLISISKK